MTIREYLKRLGATDNELTAKVVARMEQQMLIDSDLSEFQPDTVMSILSRAADGLSIANDKMVSNIDHASQTLKRLQNAMGEAMAQLDDLRSQTAGIKDAIIANPETKDAVMAYAATLRATKEIFGAEAMTADVIIAAVNAGSYMAWRSIMGPKEPEQGMKRVKY